jgi:hypothetical protein
MNKGVWDERGRKEEKMRDLKKRWGCEGDST